MMLRFYYMIATMLLLPVVYSMCLPSLPKLIDTNGFNAIHDFSRTANWLIPGKVMLGHYPGNCPSNQRKDALVEDNFAEIRGAGICTYVCLQDEVPSQDSDDWPAGGIKKTSDRAKWATGTFQNYRRFAGPDANYVHYRLPDLSVAQSLEDLDEIVCDLMKRVKDGDKLYIHCWGGRGRTGLVAACVLGGLYGEIDAEQALQRVQKAYDLRQPWRKKKSPETEEQQNQVRDWFSFKRSYASSVTCSPHDAFSIWNKKGNHMLEVVSQSANHPLTREEAERRIDEDLYAFLVQFFETFPELSNKRFFIFGESYAGMYVPSIAREIYLQNQSRKQEQQQQEKDILSNDNDDDDIIIKLEGIALGNGWIDPMIQGRTVIDYAFFHGMIDSITYQTLHQQFDASCSASSDAANSPMHSFTTSDECGTESLVLRAAGAGLIKNRSPNTYDVTTWDTYPFIDSDNAESTTEHFFNNPLVQKALNAPDIYWRGCMKGEGRRKLSFLDHDRPLSMVPYLTELMDDANIRVLIYNGDRDMSINRPGTELVLNSMTKWSGHRAWMNNTVSKRGLWIKIDESEEEAVAGYAKEYDRLTFVNVHNSGHLLPYNIPQNALELMLRFVTNTTFLDKEIKPIQFSSTSSLSTKSSSSNTTTIASNSNNKNEKNTSSTARTLLLGCFMGFTIGLCIGIAVTWDYFTQSHRSRREYQPIADHQR